MKKLSITLFFYVLFITNCYSQGDMKKTGMHIEKNTYGIQQIYYKNGLRDGLYISYNGVNGLISCFGRYEQGKQVGTWYYFDEQGHLLLEQSEIQKNTKFYLTRVDGKKLRPQFMSYIKNYYPNGYIKSEGYVIYFDDIEVDNYKVGLWKYYDTTGNLIKTETYKNLRLK